MAEFKDFQKLDFRVCKIIEVNDFPEARNPSYILKIDCGPELGIKKSSAQLTKNYTKDDLVDKLVMCLVNLSPRQIGPIMSEVLTLGFPDDENQCILVQPERTVKIGEKLY